MTSFLPKIQNEIQKNCAVILENPSNRLYITGFDTSDGAVIILKNKVYFLVDFRYYEAAKSTVTGCEIVLCERLLESVKTVLCENQIKTVFLENNYISMARLEYYRKQISTVEFSNDDFADRLLEKYREVKSQNEIAKIKAAQKMTDRTFEYILGRIEKGRTEIDIMLDMEFYMRKLGSEGVSFPFIVVSGKNSSLPHGVPTNKPIENGDFVTMDFGAVVDGYRSDMTRTVAVGQPSQKQISVYNTVLEAQNKAFEVIKKGAVCSDVDKAARDYIYGSGFKGCFGHALGHGVGIDIHEEPVFSLRCNKILQPGEVITVEPGIYIEKEFGVRIEDMVAVTDDGCENLTASPKNLIIL
ncbi:MAG: aminopeptidase P family protein [Oscillospiraceae bacterium]|nr:aminopeptidase P family protein [Candidatus Equicaccousia limihippi]